MKKLTRILLLSFLFITFFSHFSNAQTKVKKVVFQAFWWDYWNNNFPFKWSDYLTELAPRLKQMGFTSVWIPPVYKNNSPGSVGYAPFDQYDLGDKMQKGDTGNDTVRTRMGNKDELLRCIAVLHANGLEVIQDMVMNHTTNAGSRSGAGGQDPNSFSTQSAAGYKNFRYVSYATPAINESQNDYWTRAGRWSKNYQNFHPNAGHNCNSGDFCADYWGPDICYQASATGQSSNIPTSGTATINGITRAYHNPTQASNYMATSGRSWIKWFKKQTGVDGWRWDAVKHFETEIQEDWIKATKYDNGWANGGTEMFCIGEWVGSTNELNTYMWNVRTPTVPAGMSSEYPAGFNDELHTGTFDFSLRGYNDFGQGFYDMVNYNASGSFDISQFPNYQQHPSARIMTYPDGKKVHRTVNFINSHDTYRPKLDNSGNFLQPLGNTSGWDMGNELGGDGAHIDPREPRLAAAYAIAYAMDGNICAYIEDFFDIGTTGKRWSHLPTSTTDLPTRPDLVNISLAHGRLAFKDGDYRIPTNANYTAGSANNHLVIERIGKAIIGISDKYQAVSNNTADEEVWVTLDASWAAGTQLYDYSGAHGITPITIQNDKRVGIKTAPVGHTIPNAYGHGYSIWAPAPPGVTVSSVNDLYNYLSTYTTGLNPATTQEWEMADDLGDSHCASLGQGGALPTNSTNQRVVGKIFVESGKQVSFTVTPEVSGRDITISLWDLDGNKLTQTNGTGATITGTYMPTTTGWITIKVRNTNNTTAGQKVWVKATYTAPAVVNTRLDDNKPITRAAIWTGNKGTRDINDCGNWEEGVLPSATRKVVVPGNSATFPLVQSNITIKQLVTEAGALFEVAPGVTVTIAQ